jgi:hypothetical protein
MFPNRRMMYALSNGCTRPVLDPMEYHNKSNQIKGRMFSIFSMRLFKPILKMFVPKNGEVTT